MKNSVRSLILLLMASFSIGCKSEPISKVEHFSECKTLPQTGVDQIELSGVLATEVHWGPPNFGEDPKTDSKFTAWILQSDALLKIRPGVDSEASTVLELKRIQLFFSKLDDRDPKLKTMAGKHIVVTGKLWAASTPGDITEVTLMTENVEIKSELIGIQCKESP